MASSSASNISTVAEEFEKLEMEVAEVLSTEPSGEVLRMDTTKPSTPKTPSTELVVSEVQNVIQKQSILIPPRKDDPNRVFKRKKVEIVNPPPPNPPTSFEDRQARQRSSLHNFYRRRRFSQDLRMFRGLGETFLHLLDQGRAPPPSRGWRNRGRGREGRHS
ncbi:hypothetical protein V9T40_003965 [Parthenolecanium corni]|uniref:Uncharacterized protein n=1 Tax=Parthenolecanium corni TaxID=536013 RepID=A0AAN9TE88_9HEMI